jgi:cytochrome d ubiquinol oxidase subunit II
MFSGDTFSFFTFLGLLCGLGLLGGYALLGAGWLIWKTEGSTQAFAREIGHAALILAAAMMALVSGWTALSDPAVASRWFSWPNIAYLGPLPLAAVIVVFFIWRSLWGRRETLPFLLSIALFLLGFAGLVVSLWPYVVPRHISVWEGAADPQALAFAGVGILTVIPIVLAYQAHAYWVFRGKTEQHSAYGEH